MNKKKSVAIFGSGIGGLTVAHELAERGDYEITIYEKFSRCGGKTKSTITPEGYPGEHSIRTVSKTYHCFRDSLKRIPTHSGKTILDDVVAPPAQSRKFLLFKKYPVCILPCYFPFTIKGIKEYIHFFKDMKKLVPLKEIIDFNLKLIKSGAMCRKRRMDTLEKISWDQYMNIDNKSQAFRDYIHRLPEFSIAGKGNANAKSMSLLAEKALFIPWIYPFASQHSSHDLLNGPISPTLIDPWVNYLKKLGVNFRMECEAKYIEIKNGIVDHVVVAEGQQQKKVQADIYVFALSIEFMTSFVGDNKKIKEVAPSLSQLDKLNTEDTSGVQYFCSNIDKTKIPQGWILFLDSPWSVIAIYLDHQDYANYYLNPPVTSVISASITNFDVPGVLYGKPARACTAEEIKNEIWAQMMMHQGLEGLKDVQIHGWHMDPEIEFSPESGIMIKHHAPLFIRLPNSSAYQPKAVTEIPNLFLASDYVQTAYDIPTMEAANEAGRRAANGILEYTKYSGKKCMVTEDVATGFSFFQWVDQFIYWIQCYFRRPNPN